MHYKCKTIERIASFSDGRLCGITSNCQNSTTGILLLNAGLLHRPGPFRAFTDLARQLAAQGYSCMRFDLSNIGDSQAAVASAPLDKTVLSDMQDALDYMQDQFGCRNFIVIGLCTGADFAHKLAVNDRRVRGVVMMDGYGFATPRFYLKRYWHVLTDPKRLLKLLLNALKFSKNNDQITDSHEEFTWTMPSKKHFADDLKILLERNVCMLYTYTGAVRNIYIYPDQMYDSFTALPLRAALTTRCYPLADHTMTLKKDRQLILNEIQNWVLQQFDNSK